MTTATIHARFSVNRPQFRLDVDLEMPSEGVTVLFGPSGSGKTTLMRAIAGLERHPGFLRIRGDVWQDDRSGTFRPVHRRPIGYVFQEASLLPHLTVQENLAFGWKRTEPGRRTADWNGLLSLTGITSLLDRQPHTLSGGERQRVAIARALLTSPDLLLMDEPLSGLDQRRRQEILPYLERLRDELSIPMLYITHSADEMARLADHLVLLDSGKALASGPVAEVSARPEFTLAQEHGQGVVVDGTIESCDEQYGLVQIRVAHNVITVPHAPIVRGRPVRLHLAARNVCLSLERQTGTSMLNQLPATVLDIQESEPASSANVLVRLDAQGMPLLALITRRSLDLLNIAPRKQLWAQFKASPIQW